MTDVRLSVVVPARNSGPWIAELIESVLGQGDLGLELIVVDNGSTDGTTEIVRAVAARDSRVRLVTSSASSAAAARNDGVAHANGTYLVFADSDDLVPEGAYREMLGSLEASGSDMVIADHLKFSATRTWRPTERWYSFDERRVGLVPGAVPELLSSRPCWNRMFRRAFWDHAGLRFPEIDSVEDIEPMTRAFVSAEKLDVVPSCVYLYRERADASSLSLRADATVTTRYLEQELACARLVQHDTALRTAHAEIVLDADGWAHLHRFLLTAPAPDQVAPVARATEALLEAIPLDGLTGVAPIRHMLWALVMQGDWTAATAFVIGSTSAHAEDRLDAWINAVVLLLATDPLIATDLATGGLVPALVNGADGVGEAWLADRLGPVSHTEFRPTGSALSDAMVAAVGSGSSAAVRTASALRHLVPLVIDHVDVSDAGIVVGGPADLSAFEGGVALQLAGPSRQEVSTTPAPATGGWRSSVRAEDYAVGRYSVSVSFDGVDGSFPVVTARMPLPPVGPGMPMQPLADRKDGWRFLVDRRPTREGGVRGLLRRAAGRLR